jgi:hypothetical protein|tara:strand:- start:585 stop:1175 length:591 start_codon:yes stop_codon:yes gene_type:complete
MMMFDPKILDLKYHINGLMPETICQSFIRFFEENVDSSMPEQSYKYKEKKMMRDNFNCINLSELRNVDEKFVKPFEVAKQYIGICISNYVLHVQNKICPTFSDKLINKTSNIRILRYEEGENIKDHCDVGPLERASITINLNEDYEGGKFRFFDGQVKEVLKTGEAMIFPAEPIWIHGTEPVTKGTRYSINCFLHS